MKTFAVFSLLLGLAIAEPILLPHPNPNSKADSNGLSNIAAIRPSKTGGIRPLKPIERLHLNLNRTSVNYIVGGRDANPGECPYQASLRTSSHRCGCSILSNLWLLTAAHCVDGMSASQLKIRYNTLTHASGGEIVDIESIIQHPSYSSRTIDYDMAVMKLKAPMTLGQINANLIQLADASEVPKNGDTLTVSGWGTTSSGGSLPSTLKVVDVPCVGNDICLQKYGSGQITDRMFCAGVLDVGGKDSCQGDSGGPIINDKGKLVGAVSWGRGCAQPNYPGVYASVPNLRDWIRTNTGGI